MAPKILQVSAAIDSAQLEDCRVAGLDHIACSIPDGGIDALLEICARHGLTPILDIDAGRANSVDLLRRLADTGVTAFRLTGLDGPSPEMLGALIRSVRRAHADARFFAWTPGLDWRRIGALAGLGFDHGFSSLGWWDGRGAWLVEEYELLRRIGPVIACLKAADRRHLRLAAALCDGWMVPELSGDLGEAARLQSHVAALGLEDGIRNLTGGGSMVAAFFRPAARDGLVVLANADPLRPAALPLALSPLPPQAGGAFGSPMPIENGIDPLAALQPGEVRLLKATRTHTVVKDAAPPVKSYVQAPRIAIEAIAPRIDDGIHAVKRIIGEKIRVEADIFSDGHAHLSAELLWRPADDAQWRRVEMLALGNDRWRAEFSPERIGRHLFTIESWRDNDEKEPLRVQAPPVPLEVDRPEAGFASWYEIFPRSYGGFAGVIPHLPAIRDMGFDVLYMTPIHPIGRTNRKGRNNALKAEPGDPGSTYAIGAAEGGHDAIHPELGTIDDFRALRDAAASLGMELALDFAVQCSPDHPWLKQHRGWFRWMPDGSVRFAENPPKKYEDIVNVDFYAETAIPDLWLALKEVVLHWVGEGIRLFRVDNPHTKPLPFWEWLIASVRRRHPEVIFLSEAFTRPKMMYRLAKIGFGQSYTYFTWRNTKREITAYLTELTTEAPRDFFRPHFFVNTPDINPYFLQTSGRAGFLIRAALAATLSGLWGLYSGFERCEAAALPGREEYLDSEKYEIRTRPPEGPEDIRAEIAQLNRIRRAQPALQSHLGVTFYQAFNDEVILYGKTAPGTAGMILIAVSFDPHHVQTAQFELPLWEWSLPDTGSLEVEDLIRGGQSIWTGKWQSVRLDPGDLPYAIWRIAALGRT